MFEDEDLLNTHEELVKRVVDFFISEVVYPTEFTEIKNVCQVFLNKANKKNEIVFLSLGYLSISDFSYYASHKKYFKEGIKIDIVQTIVEILKKNKIINQQSSMINAFVLEPRYKVNPVPAFLYSNFNIIYNVIFGFNYIIKRYRQSVFKIENIDKNEDYSIGTGFLITTQFDYDIILTNKHVLEKSKMINIYDSDDNKIGHKGFYLDGQNDLAIIILNEKLPYEKFTYQMNEDYSLEEVITIGYPSIPMSSKAFQVVHKGEVNSHITDYSGHKLFLFSAKTSSGNSGSPVINKTGMVIGIVTEELFEEEAFVKKGKLPYYAAIPIEEFIPLLKKYEESIK